MTKIYPCNDLFTGYCGGTMETNKISSNQRVVFNCSRDKVKKRGLVSNVNGEKANIVFYDGKYAMSQEVTLDNIICEDTIGADMRMDLS